MKTYQKIIYAMTIMGIWVLGGCEDDPNALSGIGVEEQEHVSSRADDVGSFTPASGFWGDWTQTVYCNPNTWAHGYQMRVEGSQGGGDDTALNAVQLHCATRRGERTETIVTHHGLWGSWGESAYCPSTGFLTGADMRVERPQGGGDDTAANDVRFACSNGSTIQAGGGQSWGDWQGWYSCPAGSAVCGFSVRFEADQGGGDDTAMNGMTLRCCTLP